LLHLLDLSELGELGEDPTLAIIGFRFEKREKGGKTPFEESQLGLPFLF